MCEASFLGGEASFPGDEASIRETKPRFRETKPGQRAPALQTRRRASGGARRALRRRRIGPTTTGSNVQRNGQTMPARTKAYVQNMTGAQVTGIKILPRRLKAVSYPLHVALPELERRGPAQDRRPGALRRVRGRLDTDPGDGGGVDALNAGSQGLGTALGQAASTSVWAKSVPL